MSSNSTEKTITPVDELRHAAQTLREIAAKATRGPWICYRTVSRSLYLDEDHAYTVGRGYCDKEHNGDECEPDCGADVVRTGAMGCREDALKGDDAAWIATVHPGVAEPLAEWLDYRAECVDAMVNGASKIPEKVATATPENRYALKVARVIHGTAS